MTKELFKLNVMTLRKSRGWSQEKLAEEAGVSYHTIFRVEAGVVPRGQNITKIAKALGVEESSLFSDPNSKKLESTESRSDLILAIQARLTTLNEEKLRSILSLISQLGASDLSDEKLS